MDSWTVMKYSAWCDCRLCQHGNIRLFNILRTEQALINHCRLLYFILMYMCTCVILQCILLVWRFCMNDFKVHIFNEGTRAATIGNVLRHVLSVSGVQTNGVGKRRVESVQLFVQWESSQGAFSPSGGWPVSRGRLKKLRTIYPWCITLASGVSLST